MNKVVLVGRLTRDPEVRYSQGNNATAVARYTVAVDRRFRRDGDSQTADFIGCVAFGRQAEFAEKYLRKGTKIALTGRIQTGSYTNRDGQKVYTTDVVVEEQEFAESKAASAEHAANFAPADRPSMLPLTVPPCPPTGKPDRSCPLSPRRWQPPVFRPEMSPGPLRYRPPVRALPLRSESCFPLHHRSCLLYTSPSPRDTR